ncbi:unnamed protein product [Linum trigynum]|uniref:Uncharacterized protein n=1 Tax=Linum trigynum TaxID=586398 RepID=A0AAV2CY22_9ROSI
MLLSNMCFLKLAHDLLNLTELEAGRTQNYSQSKAIETATTMHLCQFLQQRRQSETTDTYRVRSIPLSPKCLRKDVLIRFFFIYFAASTSLFSSSDRFCTYQE